MIKNLLLLFVFGGLSIPVKVLSQPLPCDSDNPDMTPTCLEACIICDIDGFSGRHESDVVGTLPNDFCTLVVHNAQWIAFQAASTNLKIRLSVSNCSNGNALEMAIYRSLDCNNFTMISNCRGAMNSVNEGTSAEFETTEQLIIGQYYYLAMDGTMGANCDWVLEVLEGSTELAPLTFTEPIIGEDRICPGLTHTYTTEPEEGAVLFDWTLDGVAIGDNTQSNLDLTIDDEGVYELCVMAKNACDEATPSCKQILVLEIPDTDIIDFFCSGDCYEIDGNTFCETGLYQYSISLDNGCDSTIVLDLTELEQPINDLSLNICEGDTFYVEETPYLQDGFYTQIVQNDLLCDSIVNLDLRVIICNMQSDFNSNLTICNGESSGSVTFNIVAGTPPFNYTWQHLQSNLEGSGSILNTLEDQIISGLPVGDVIIEIKDDFGNSDVLIVRVDEPDVISINSTISDFNGYNVSCIDRSDGSINVEVDGGIAPYDYQWSSGQNTPTVEALGADSFSVSVVDALGCERVFGFELREPDSIHAEVQFNDPSCAGLNTGTIEVVEIDGGAGSYLFSLNGSDTVQGGLFTDLPPAIYTLRIIDANQCSSEQGGELFAPQIVDLSGQSSYSVQLGCEVVFEIDVNDIDISEIYWADDSNLSCNNCLNPTSNPMFSGLNTVFVSSVDNCVDSFSVEISIDKLRAFYAPNVFSPNDDGFNDLFFIHGGKEVNKIDLFLFDRWGNKIFEQINVESAADSLGWDGTYNGRRAESGLYLWIAEVTFIDGFTSTFEGDVALVR